MVLSSYQRETLRSHVYKTEGCSLIESLLLNHFWSWLTTKFPLWLAPNTITFIGFISTLLATLCVVLNDLNCEGTVRLLCCCCCVAGTCVLLHTLALENSVSDIIVELSLELWLLNTQSTTCNYYWKGGYSLKGGYYTKILVDKGNGGQWQLPITTAVSLRDYFLAGSVSILEVLIAKESCKVSWKTQFFLLLREEAFLDDFSLIFCLLLTTLVRHTLCVLLRWRRFNQTAACICILTRKKFWLSSHSQMPNVMQSQLEVRLLWRDVSYNQLQLSYIVTIGTCIIKGDYSIFLRNLRIYLYLS